MTLDAVIMLFGALVALLPFMQLSQNWTYFLAFIFGVIIIGLGIAVRRRGSAYATSSDQGELFDEDAEAPQTNTTETFSQE